MANRILPGYNMPVGEKIDLIIDHDGPSSYTNSGVFSTSGETLNASDIGLGGLEMVNAGMLSSDGLNFVQITPTNQSTSTTAVGTGGNALTSVKIHWYVLASGAEVANGTNLSAKSIRLHIRGV